MMWDVRRTKAHIEALFGHEQMAKAGASIHSADDRLEFARYHYQEHGRLVEEFLSTHIKHEEPSFIFALAREDGRSAFGVLMIKVGAHTVACVQSLHSIPDMLAHAVYHSLNIDASSRIAPHRVSAGSVSDALDYVWGGDRLARILRELCATPEAKHVAALANRAKHRSIVKPALNEDHSGSRRRKHEVHFPKFDHHGISYPSCPAEQVLEKAYSQANRALLDMGAEIDRFLQSISP